MEGSRIFGEAVTGGGIKDILYEKQEIWIYQSKRRSQGLGPPFYYAMETFILLAYAQKTVGSRF
jgi:hypothetical protein